MKRGKKIAINMCIVLLLFVVIYFTGGFYFSREKCELNTLKAYNREYTGKVIELSNGNKTLAIYGNYNEFQFDVIATEKVGFLYKRIDWLGIVGKTFEGQVMDWAYFDEYTENENEAVILIVRTDPALAKVEVAFEDGSRMVVDEWDQNITECYVEIPVDDYEFRSSFSFYCYDEAGQLIDEI